jgi:hypothetical protein
MEIIRPQILFICFIVFCLSIVYFKNLNITLGTFLGFLIAVIICVFIYLYDKKNISTKERIHQTKVENIKPKPNRIQNYDDLTDFIFSIQDFYIYNPQAFIEIVNSLDTFLNIYENVIIDENLAGDFFSIADEYKTKSLNALQSIIITLPSSKELTKKFNQSLKNYEELINNYLYQIYEINQNLIKKNGYFNNTKLFDINIEPYNKNLKDFSLNEIK